MGAGWYSSLPCRATEKVDERLHMDRSSEGEEPALSAACSLATTRKLRLSINAGIVNKTVPDNSLYVDGWENVELTIAEFAEAVAGQGHAYCAQLKGRRESRNFLASDIVSVDVDHGMTIEEALANPLVRDSAALLYPTSSHTDADPKFRIVFVTPRTITDPNEMEAISRSLALRLMGDSAVTDAAHLFFGHRGVESIMIGRQLGEVLVAELIAQGKIAKGKRQLDSRNSSLIVAANVAVRLADDQVLPLQDVVGRPSAYCPYHADRRPSAFVVTSRAGVKGIHCSTCGQTYWPSGDISFSFDHFEQAVREAHRVGGGTGDLGGVKIDIVSGKATPERLDPGLTFIKSPKGTGKTEGVKRLPHHEDSILVIGHRRLLNRQISGRLELNSYRDRNLPPWRGARDDRLDRFAVSVDSLELVPANKEYDVIVLDEVEQVLQHFRSETLKARERVFLLFSHLIRNARSVIALDADLGWATFHTLSRMRAGLEGTAATRRIWLNEDLPGSGKTVQIYDSEQALVGELQEALKTGKKCLMASTSKGRVERLSAAMTEMLPEIRQLAVTSDTSGSEAVEQFIADPAGEMMKYDVVLASPSLGTGIDITFPDNEQVVDVVFGFCDPEPLTHFDFDQQLGRVRHPKEIKVWVSPRLCSYETNQDVVRDDILRKGLYKEVLIGFDPEGKRVFKNDDPLIEMAAIIDSQRRASLNSIKAHFVRHKQAQGYEIVHVGKDSGLAATGSDIFAIGRELDDAAYASRVLAGGVLTESEFERLKRLREDGKDIADDQRASLARTGIELFYRHQVDMDLIKLDDRGRHRKRARLYEDVAGELKRRAEGLTHSGSPASELRNRFLPNVFWAAPLLVDLLERTPLIRDNAFDPDAEFKSDDLAAFAGFCLEKRDIIASLLQEDVRQDIRKKPVQQLNRLLRKIGLCLTKARRVKQNGTKVIYYRLDVATLGAMSTLTRRRRESGGWAALNEIYGRTSTWPYDENDDDLAWLAEVVEPQP